MSKVFEQGLIFRKHFYIFIHGKCFSISPSLKCAAHQPLLSVIFCFTFDSSWCLSPEADGHHPGAIRQPEAAIQSMALESDGPGSASQHGLGATAQLAYLAFLTVQVKIF